VIDQLPEATMLRIEGQGGQRQVYSLLRNRAHSNVAFLLGEAYRYQPGLDTLTCTPACSAATRTSSSTSRPRMCRFVEPGSAVTGEVRAVVMRWGVRAATRVLALLP
jgi:hypothetical protein